ncbi:hypothetical protein GOGPGP_GOGPGP_10130, partial [Dysosmobacter welbionis]
KSPGRSPRSAGTGGGTPPGGLSAPGRSPDIVRMYIPSYASSLQLLAAFPAEYVAAPGGRPAEGAHRAALQPSDLPLQPVDLLAEPVDLLKLCQQYLGLREGAGVGGVDHLPHLPQGGAHRSLQVHDPDIQLGHGQELPRPLSHAVGGI